MINHENHELHEKFIYKEECYAIYAAVFDVYKEMGYGFLEAVYQECLLKEFKRRQIPFIAQPVLKLTYKGELLEQVYRPDIMCYDKVILELKAAKDVAPEHKAQMINYLKTTGFKLGLLINFGSYPIAKIERFVL
jgi:GxxExxY protein